MSTPHDDTLKELSTRCECAYRGTCVVCRSLRIVALKTFAAEIYQELCTCYRTNVLPSKELWEKIDAAQKTLGER